MSTYSVNTTNPTILKCRVSSNDSSSKETMVSGNSSNYSTTNITKIAFSKSKSNQINGNINDATVFGDKMSKCNFNSLVDTTTITTTSTKITVDNNHTSPKCDLNSLSDRNIIDKLLSCFRPLMYFIQKEKSFPSSNQDLPWEVPFESVTDLIWIGSGAQGVVFRGCFRNELVAVKKVSRQSDTDIRHLRYLNHPNVIKFRGVCVEQPCYCILMEYCPYGQLYEIIHSGNPISPSLICSWVKQIADGMHYLHSCKIIHRDLKSPNVLVGYNHVLKISDFGASRECTENSTKMSFTGTVAWMAPEVIRNEPCSFKVDVWSYGVLLWELLTGEIPYHNVDSTAILWGVGSEHLRLPVPVTCPSELRVLMKTCWNIRPRNRPSFRQILSHLNVTCSSLLQYTDDEFISLRQLWKEEIAVYLQDIRLEGQCTPKLEVMLIRRRREELCHAQDIRRCYDDKRERANELCIELQTLLNECEEQKRKAERERLYYETLVRELTTQKQQQHDQQQDQHNGNCLTVPRRTAGAEKLRFSDSATNYYITSNTHDSNNANVNINKQFPFSTLSTFSLGRKLSDLYNRRRNNLKSVKSIQSSFLLSPTINSSVNSITTTTTTFTTTGLANATISNNKSILDSMEAFRSHQDNKPISFEQFYEIYLRHLINNNIFNTTINNSDINSINNKNYKCPFCGHIYSNKAELLKFYHHRRAFTLSSMMEYKLTDKLDIDKAYSLIYGEMNNNYVRISPLLLYDSKKQFASTNSLHYLVPPPPPPPAYDSVINNNRSRLIKQSLYQNIVHEHHGTTVQKSPLYDKVHIDSHNGQALCHRNRCYRTSITSPPPSSSSSSPNSPKTLLGFSRLKNTVTTTTATTSDYTTTVSACDNNNNNLISKPNEIQSDVIFNSAEVNDSKPVNRETIKSTNLLNNPLEITKIGKEKSNGIGHSEANKLQDPSKLSNFHHLSSLYNNVTSKYHQINYQLKRSVSQDSLIFYAKKFQLTKNDFNAEYCTLSKKPLSHLNKVYSSCKSIFSTLTSNTLYWKSSPFVFYLLSSPVEEQLPGNISDKHRFSQSYGMSGFRYLSGINKPQKLQTPIITTCSNESRIEDIPDKTIQNKSCKLQDDKRKNGGFKKLMTTDNFPFLEHVSPLWSPSKCLFHYNRQVNNKGGRTLLSSLPSSFSPKFSTSIPTILPRRSNSNKTNVNPNNNKRDEKSTLSHNICISSVMTPPSSPSVQNSKENPINGNIQLRKYPGRRNILRNSFMTTADQSLQPRYNHRHHSRLHTSSQLKRNSSSLFDLSGYRSTSLSSSPVSSIGTRTHMSIENLANELQSHMFDSLSDKEFHVRRVRSRLRRQQQSQQPCHKPFPIQITSIDNVSAPTQTSLVSSPTPPPPYVGGSLSLPISNLVIPNDIIVNEQNLSAEPTFLSSHLPDQSSATTNCGFNEQNNANPQLRAPNSLVFITSTCTTISSITEAEVDLSDDDINGQITAFNEDYQHNDEVLPLENEERIIS
ncbi:hypothetical protein MN116_008608 [Schistosoma mekongi]|uniref:Protein kinase domain-containing protein n=1 Tax=Schistosoma mekongi TaxID=38744 RepID=A0AAE1Z6C2_SCHME|nr:hypothetical protein MN116_008608 [Schistosoma mekongi]